MSERGQQPPSRPVRSFGRMSLFITCPVESVDRATAFYTALGWTLNAGMSDHHVSCDYPFKYQRQFDEPDGYHYSPF